MHECGGADIHAGDEGRIASFESWRLHHYGDWYIPEDIACGSEAHVYHASTAGVADTRRYYIIGVTTLGEKKQHK